ncbi:RNA polymerase sigma factor [Kitasatospora phosalacinea]|uniref:RNA polymerase sigma factor n=1 Tax=Kitasatospora phosalacinea TaxID=2065 RepID=UPI0035E200CA
MDDRPGAVDGPSGGTATRVLRADSRADDDAEVIAASLAEPDRFGEVYDRHAPAVHRYLARRVGAAVADDLTSETFLAAFRIRGRYDPERPDARPWLYGIATNLLRRHHRAERAGYRALARSGVDPLDAADHADAVAARVSAGARAVEIAEVLAALTAKERDVLLLFAWAELTYHEIAEALVIPLGTVRSRLNRARRRLHTALDRSKH